MTVASHFLDFYRQAYAAVTDFTFYRTVFQQTLRKTLLYVFLLSAQVAGLLTLSIAYHYGPQLLDFSGWAQQHFPSLQVEDGKLWVGTDQPLIATYPGKQFITFIFDTTGTHSNPEEFPEPALLFTEDRLYIRYLGQTQTHLWSDISKEFGPFRVGPSEIEHLIGFFKWIYLPLFYFFMLIFTLLKSVVFAALSTLIGVSSSGRYNIQLPFQQYITIAFYSLTPAIVLDLGVTMTGLQISYFSYFIYVITAAIYTFMATQKCVATE